MWRYFLKRAFISVPTLLGISLICFVLIQLTPGGPVEQTMAQWRASSGGEAASGRLAQVTEEQRQALVAYYGFDKPIYVRYFRWMEKLLRFDFGDSYSYNQPVSQLIRQAMPVSLTFGLFSFLASYLICIPLGIAKAVRHGSWFDMMTSGLVFFLYSIPPFAFGILLIVLLGGGSFWKVFPIEGLTSDNFSELSTLGKVKDYFNHVFLPLTCYTIGSFASLTMIMKDSLLEQLSQDYVVTARAKGLPGEISRRETCLAQRSIAHREWAGAIRRHLLRGEPAYRDHLRASGHRAPELRIDCSPRLPGRSRQYNVPQRPHDRGKSFQ